MTAAGGTISLLVGLVLLRLTLTGTYTRYVREELAPFLVVAGVAVLVLGVVTLVQALRRVKPVDAHDHHHDGDGVPVGWLLLAPIAALLLVAPPTLGSYGVGRAASIDIRAGAGVFEPLERTGEPAAMSLLEFSQRAFEKNGASFNRAPVRLTGFVSQTEPGGFRLARYQIACCAADAAPVVVRIVGTEGVPPLLDQWVSVTGTFEPGSREDDLPALAATSVEEIPAPDDPYE